MRRTTAPLIQQLLETPGQFDFFQAVRLLERAINTPTDTGTQRDSPAIDQVVRFRAHPSLSFSPAAIAEIQSDAHEPFASVPAAILEVVVTFLGLTGPSGVLPHHYTSLLISRLREKDSALRDFLDLFNHRITWLFFRAWEKYRFPTSYERMHSGQRAVEDGDRSSSPQDDPFTTSLFCLCGMGFQQTRRKRRIDPESILYYGGHFCHLPRNAISLQMILCDYFELPVCIEQHVGQWLMLTRGQQTQLAPGRFQLGGNRLGDGAIVGDRAWDVQGQFRMRIGPLSYQQFRSFIPGGEALELLVELVQSYVGLELGFEIQPVLLAAEVPAWQLQGGSGLANQPHPTLGRDLWLRDQPFTSDFDGAIFPQ